MAQNNVTDTQHLLDSDPPAHGYWGDPLPDLSELEPLGEDEAARRQTDPNGFVYDPLSEQQCVHEFKQREKAWLERHWHALPEALRSFAWRWLRDEVRRFKDVAEWEEVKDSTLKPCVSRGS